MEASTVLSIAALTISGILAYYLNRVYGDVAGAKLIIEYEKERAEQARIVALKSLVNQTELARQLAQANAQGDPALTSCGGLIRMPVRAFETAFVSGESVLSDEQELLDTVTEYLSSAYTINALVDVYLSLASGPGNIQSGDAQNTVSQVRQACRALSDVLDRLEPCLRKSPRA